jgi:glucose/arabinose dehydrogenase
MLRFGMLMATTMAAMSVQAMAADTVQTKKVEVQVETIASGLEHPWAVAVLPDGGYLVTERPAGCASSVTASFRHRFPAFPRSAHEARAD